MRRQSRFAVAATLLALAASFALCLPRAAIAHRDDYIHETFVYQTLERHEFEIELWEEGHGGAGRATTLWSTAAFEYGVTSRWTLDAAGQWERASEATRFGRLRAETRYRFAEENRWPLDLALSAEYERERAGEGAGFEQTLTPRVVISKDLLRSFNSTLNLDLPIALEERHDVTFAWALGVRYPAEGSTRVGVEVQQRPAAHQAVVFPQLWFAFPHEMTVKLGTGIGLTQATEPLIARGVFEIEF